MTENSYVLIGKVHSAQGLRGEIYISIFAEEADWAEQWETLYLSNEPEESPSQEMEITKWKVHAKQKRWGFIVNLDGVSDRNGAEELVGMKVYIPESFLVSEEGEWLHRIF